MNDSTSERPPATVSLLLLFLVGTFFFLLALRSDAEEVRGVESRATPAGAAGAKVALDQSTGQLVVPPPATASRVVPSARVDALSTSHEGLVAVRGVSRAGGVMVDLKGRFRSAVVATVVTVATVATVGADGATRTETRCVPAPTSGDVP